LASPFLSVVIPAYNEEYRLPRTLEQIFLFLQEQSYASEVFVIENGSGDRTYEVAREFAERHKNLHVLKEERRGKGNAVKRGMLEAHGAYRFLCDADLSMPIAQIDRFLPPQLDTDIAIGSREAPGAVRYNEPEFRHFGGRLINLAIRLLILPGLQDTQCGFKCFRAEVADKIFSCQSIPGWSFDIEVLYIARKYGYQIVEVPIDWYFDAETKLRAVNDALRMLRDIFLIHRNNLRGLYDPQD
jgi:dolichyl-phosphate beta-glucosyltransferase